jgi:hypothetical protein
LSRITTVEHAGWAEAAAPAVAETATVALERGSVLFLPRLPFVVEPQDHTIFSPTILSSAKNTSFDPATGTVGGTTLSGAALGQLQQLLSRFSAASADLVGQLFPPYRGRLVRARASFRPAEIAGRETTWRKDDTRLHIDSFPASPVQGRRILRVFTNVNPSERPRRWRVGPDFEAVARRFAGALSMPVPLSGLALQALKITKSRRTAYDHLMLQLHDRMKESAEFQERCEQERFEFPSGSTWVAFTDQVSHAAMAGQYQFEQTFLVPVDAMQDEQRSPLRVLEALTGQRLA